MKTEEQITVPFLIEECRKYYALPDNGVGGSLHIVLDDDNIENHHIQWCIEHAQEKGDVEGVRLGNLLLKASKTQRKRLVKSYSQYS